MNASRSCVRCRKELTDAASMEAGIGPVCRNLDNALLAKLIPSKVGEARAAAGSVDLTEVAPETLPTLALVMEALESEPSPEDWRETVKRIEWALSFSGNNPIRPHLTKVVAALGYVGLAALWSGEAATGKATLVFSNMTGPQKRLVFVGPRHRAARQAFRAIPGWRFHPAGTILPKAAWSFPADQFNAVHNAVATHYPNSPRMTEAIADAKLQALLDGPGGGPKAAPKEAPKAPPKCSMTQVGTILKVRTPYNPHFLIDLKDRVKWSDRRWNAHEKVWEVALGHEAAVKALVHNYFGADALKVF